jgi:hypothetical protein
LNPITKELIMGYAEVKGPYHKGPKKNKKARKFNKPQSSLPPTDEHVIKVLAQMGSADMSTFLEATTYPNPRDVVIVRGTNGRPRPVVLEDADERQTHSGRVWVGIADFGLVGGGSCHQPQPQPRVEAVKVKVNVPPVPPKEAIEGEIVGYLIKKPNGEIVVKFK